LVGPAGFRADKLHLGAGVTEGTVYVHIERKAEMQKDLSLVFRAKGEVGRGATAVSETSVLIR
jgi:hypothetical protein